MKVRITYESPEFEIKQAPDDHPEHGTWGVFDSDGDCMFAGHETAEDARAALDETAGDWIDTGDLFDAELKVVDS